MRTANTLHNAFDEKGPILFRSKEDLHKTASKEKIKNDLLELVKSRSGHLIETKNHYIVVYGTDHLKIWC